jgi:ribosomal protein L31
VTTVHSKVTWLRWHECSTLQPATQNASTSLLDLLDIFQEFVRDAAYKDLKNIQQYTTKSTRSTLLVVQVSSGLHPMKIRDVEMDISVYRAKQPCISTMANDFLMHCLRNRLSALNRCCKQ